MLAAPNRSKVSQNSLLAVAEKNFRLNFICPISTILALQR